MSETTRKEKEEVDIVQNNVEGAVVEPREAVLQKIKATVAVASKRKAEAVRSNCNSPLISAGGTSATTAAKPRSTKKPLTAKPNNFSAVDLDEFISLVNQDSLLSPAGEDAPTNELDQWREMLMKREEKPSKFKLDKNQLEALLRRTENDALSTLTSLNTPSTSLTFEGTPLGDVLRSREADLSVASKEPDTAEQEGNDVNESQSRKVASRFFENTEELNSLYVPFNEARSQISIYEGLLELSLGNKFEEYVFG